MRALQIAAAVTILSSACKAEVPGCALAFDGTDDQVNVPYNSCFPDSVYTVTAWIKTSKTDPQNIMSRGEDNGSDVLPWGLGTSTGGLLYLQIEHGSHSGEVYYGSTLLADDQLHHVAVSRDSLRTVTLYVDGGTDATIPNSVSPAGSSGHPLQIGYSLQGGEPPEASNFFSGQLDELTLWNTALSASDISAIHAGALLSPNFDTAGLLGYWKVDEGAGQFAFDSSSDPFILNAVLGSSSAPDSFDPSWTCPPSSAEILQIANALNLRLAGPNPFTGSTRIEYFIPVRTNVQLDVYTIAGRRVRSLLNNREHEAGLYSLPMSLVSDDAAFLVSGTYFLRLSAAGHSKQLPVTVLR